MKPEPPLYPESGLRSLSCCTAEQLPSRPHAPDICGCRCCQSATEPQAANEFIKSQRGRSCSGAPGSARPSDGRRIRCSRPDHSLRSRWHHWLDPGSAIPVVGDAFDVLIRANMKNTDKAASTPQRYQLSDCRAHCRHEQQAGLEPDGLLAVV